MMINLYDYQDLKYKDFTSKLLPGVNNIIGIRIPILRKLSKNLELSDLTDNTFEEIMLQGFIISRIKDIDNLLLNIDLFLPKIDNWSICDSFCASLKIANKYQEQMFLYLESLIEKNIFTRRFVLVMLLDHYINDLYIDRVIEVLYKIKKDEYYTVMASAWLISVIYIKYPDKGLRILKSNNLSDLIINKSISKICDSYRVDKFKKKELRSLRR